MGTGFLEFGEPEWRTHQESAVLANKADVVRALPGATAEDLSGSWEHCEQGRQTRWGVAVLTGGIGTLPAPEVSSTRGHYSPS